MIETYLPLYRKYRPQSFADVVGQEAIVQTLGNAIALQKVAHAYLFCGPRGTGKTSTARIFAKSLNCEQGPTFTPCQTCASCTGITAGNAIDVIEFDAASNNGVEDARELIENCQFAPMSGKYKIYIIDEVHMLSTSAFNALLKTLEEPPANVIFIFATTEAHKVLPTIISRCQRFDFSRITNQAIVNHLASIAEKEQVSITPEALQIIARQAKGGLRDALGLLDQVSVLAKAEQGKTIEPGDVTRFIGGLDESCLLALTDAIAKRDTHTLLTLLQDQQNQGIEATQMVKELTQHLRHLLLTKVSGNTGSAQTLDLSEGYFTKLTEQSCLFETEELPQMLHQLSSLEWQLRQTQQPQLWLEIGLIDLAYRQDIALVKSLTERVEKLEAQLAGQPSQAPSAPSPRVATPPQKVTQPAAPATSMAPTLSGSVQPASPKPTAEPATPQPMQTVAAVNSPQPPITQTPSPQGDLYSQICQTVASIPTRQMMQDHSTLLSYENGQLKIGCRNEIFLKNLQNPTKLIHIKKAAEQILGKAVEVSLTITHNPITTQPKIQVPSAVPTTPVPETPSAQAMTPQPIQPTTTASVQPATEPAHEPALTSTLAFQGYDEEEEDAAYAARQMATAVLATPKVAPQEQSSPTPSTASPAAPSAAALTSATSPVAPPRLTTPASTEDLDPDSLKEAKQIAVELLQGKIVD